MIVFKFISTDWSRNHSLQPIQYEHMTRELSSGPYSIYLALIPRDPVPQDMILRGLLIP